MNLDVLSEFQLRYNKSTGKTHTLWPNNPYHNLEHVMNFDYSTCPSYEAKVAAIFHDALYDPSFRYNEDAAINALRLVYEDTPESSRYYNYEKVVKLIESTKNHNLFSRDCDSDPDLAWLHSNDLKYLREKNPIKIIETEKLFFKEYQFTNFSFYVEKRKEVLNSYKDHPYVDNETIRFIGEFLDSWKPNVAVAGGSFNPFHVGHLDVIQKAERVFDKVIIAQGQNLEKPTNDYSLLTIQGIKKYEKRIYAGSLFEFLNKLNKEYPNLTLIRGLRNNDDMEQESTLNVYKEQFAPNVTSMYILSDPKFQHVSSGAIRQLEKLKLSTLGMKVL